MALFRRKASKYSNESSSLCSSLGRAEFESTCNTSTRRKGVFPFDVVSFEGKSSGDVRLDVNERFAKTSRTQIVDPTRRRRSVPIGSFFRDRCSR